VRSAIRAVSRAMLAGLVMGDLGCACPYRFPDSAAFITIAASVFPVVNIRPNVSTVRFVLVS
jgi:hypothetical protein